VCEWVASRWKIISEGKTKSDFLKFHRRTLTRFHLLLVFSWRIFSSKLLFPLSHRRPKLLTQCKLNFTSWKLNFLIKIFFYLFTWCTNCRTPLSWSVPWIPWRSPGVSLYHSTSCSKVQEFPSSPKKRPSVFAKHPAMFNMRLQLFEIILGNDVLIGYNILDLYVCV